MGQWGRTGAALALASTLTGCWYFTSCFVRGTRVRTPSGTTPIETLTVGDEVIAFDVKTLELVPRRIKRVYVARVLRVRTIVTSTRRVTTTDEHPFWESEERAWKRAGDLRVGSVLAVLEGGRLVPEVVERVIDEARSADVFNIEVEGEHTYLAEDIAVHNKSTPCESCAPPPAATDIPVPPPSDRPLPPSTGGISVINETSGPIEIRVVSLLESAFIADSVADGTFSFPSTVPFPETSAPRLRIERGRFLTFNGGALTIKSSKLDQADRQDKGGVFDIEGERVLILGEGAFAVKGDRERGLAFTNGNPKLKIVPLDAPGLACETSAARQAFTIPPLEPALSPGPYVLSTKDADGECTTFVGTVTTVAGIPPIELRICVPALWPFAAGDVVTVGPPKALYKYSRALRIERESDEKAVELGHARENGDLFFASTPRVLADRKGNCVLAPASGCSTLDVRPNLVEQGTLKPISPTTPIPLSDGQGDAYFVGTSRSLYSLDCSKEKFGVTFDVIVHPK